MTNDWLELNVRQSDAQVPYSLVSIVSRKLVALVEQMRKKFIGIVTGVNILL